MTTLVHSYTSKDERGRTIGHKLRMWIGDTELSSVGDVQLPNLARSIGPRPAPCDSPWDVGGISIQLTLDNPVTPALFADLRRLRPMPWSDFRRRAGAAIVRI